MELDEVRLIRAIDSHPELLLQEAARRNLLHFAPYVKPDYQLTPFHRNYLRILDKFAHREVLNLIVQAPTQHGKALQVDTPVLTTEGWKRHGDLRPGDYVFGEDGLPKKVLWNSGSYLWHCQLVRFADGFSLIAAREHEWEIYADRDDHKGRRRVKVETQEIMSRRYRRSSFIYASAVLRIGEASLPIDPYLLGVWLGDGNSRDKWITCADEDLAHYLPYALETKRDKSAWRVHLRGLETRELRLLGVLKNKHIPTSYLLASESQRRALLQGLMDTDGSAEKRGSCEFCQKAGRLAGDVYELLRSLGYKATEHTYPARLYGKDCGQKVRIIFRPDKGERVFRMERKQWYIDNKIQGDRDDKRKFFISSVEDCPDCTVNCIQVEDGMYLAGRQLVPTHNSEGSSRLLPTFIHGINPDAKIAICSYAATVATDFNRDCQRIIDSPEYMSIFPDTRLNSSNVVTVSTNYLRNSNVYEIVGHRGSLRAIGRGGALTSKTVDIIIFDDLYKDASEANSPVIREGAWDWYTKVALTRLHNQSQKLIVFTRWHPEDIIGKILEREEVIIAKNWADLERGREGTWILVNFEAIKTGEPTEIDPREPGEPLYPQRHSLEKLEALRKIDPVGFECMQQGNPGNAEGRLYQPFKTWVEKSDWGIYIRSGCYIDVADEGSDYLAAVSYDVYRSDNQFYNEKTKRFEPILFALVTGIEFTQEGTEVTGITVPRLINENGVQRAWVESNNGGSQFEKNIKKKVLALTVPFYQGANKESRIVTNAPFVNQSIIFPFGWETRYPGFYKHLTEFRREFSANRHDDGPDCLTGVFEKEIADGNAKPYNAASRGVKVH